MSKQITEQHPSRDAVVEAKHIAAYLQDRDDFALEIRVFKAAKEAALQVRHGGTYVDPLSEKAREFDLRALANDGQRRLDMAIECKNLQTSYPLLVSRLKREASEAYHDVVQWRSNNFPPWHKVRASSSRVYAQDQWVGKSFTQIGHDGKGGWSDRDNGTFDKWSQAINSSVDLITAACTVGSVSNSVVIPALVVSNKTLWVVDYDESGRTCGEPHVVDEATCFVGREHSIVIGSSSIRINTSHLHIFTEDGIKKFFGQVQIRGSEFLDFFDYH